MGPIVPETPENHNPGTRRRSSRISRRSTFATPRTALKASDDITEVMETPDTSRNGVQVTRIDETPGSKDAMGQIPARPRLFSRSKVDEKDVGSEDTFVRFVTASEDMASTRIEDKVGLWLQSNLRRNLEDKPAKLSPTLAKIFCKTILEKDCGKDSAPTTPDNPKSVSQKRRRSSLLFGPMRKTPKLSSTMPSYSPSPLECVSENNEDAAKKEGGAPATSGYNPPDFSSDSAKALIAEFEKKSAKGSHEDVQDDVDEVSSECSTIPSSDFILKDVVAHVEVRTLHENRSKGVEGQLVSMGAKISEKLNNQVTHLVFKDGSVTTYNRAKKMGVFIVSVMWIEACMKKGTKVPEGLYPSVSKDKYDSPGLHGPKLRKAKSMQPKSEDWNLLEKRRKPKKKCPATVVKEEENPKTPVLQYPIPLDYYNSPRPDNHGGESKRNVYDEMVSELRTPTLHSPSPTRRLSASHLSNPGSPSSDDFNTPLAKRIASRIRKLGTSKKKQETESDADLNGSTNLRSEGLKNDSVTSEISQLENKAQVEEDGNLTSKPPLISPEEKSKKRGKKRTYYSILEQGETATQEKKGEEAKVPLKPTKKKGQKSKARKPLFTQTSMLSTTASSTPPPQINDISNVHAPKIPGKVKKKVQKTKIIRAGDDLIAIPPTQSQDQCNKIPLPSSTLDHENAKPSVSRQKAKREPRKSSFEFIKEEPKRTRVRAGDLNEIVATSFKKEDIDLLQQLITKLGRYKFGQNVTKETGIVVCGDTRRTINILKGLLRGCWILSKDWLLASLDADVWADKESFEMITFSEAVRQCRMERISFGHNVYQSKVLSGCGSLYFSRHCNAPLRDMKELAKLAGATVANVARVADIVVGEHCDNRICVTEIWFFDSLQRNFAMSPENYIF